MKYLYLILSILFFSQNIFAQIDTENDYLLILQDYHLPRWNEKVANGEKQEIRKFLVDAWKKDLVVQYKNLTDSQREVVYEVLSKKAIVNLGYFIELKDSLVAPEDLSIFDSAKNQMGTLLTEDRSQYWSFFANTGSVNGVEVLINEFNVSLKEDKPHLEKSITDLLLRNFEGIDTKSYGPPVQKIAFYAPNLDRPYFKKDNKELFFKKLNEFDKIVKYLISSKKYLTRYPDLHNYYLETDKRITSLKEGKVFVTDINGKTSNGNSSQGRSIASQSDSVKGSERTSVAKQTTSKRMNREPAEESDNSSVNENEPSDNSYKWILFVLFFILIIFSFFFFKNKK